MVQQKKTQYRDMQIMLAIENLYSCSILELLEYCIEYYPKFSWDYHIIRNSIIRLYNNNSKRNKKICFSYGNNKNLYFHSNKEYIQLRNIKFISICDGDNND